MQRSVKVSLKFGTAKKLRHLNHLLRCMRKLTNEYIDHIWANGGALDAATLNAIPCSHLSYRQRTDCLKYALEVIDSTRASAAALGVDSTKPILKHAFKFSSLTCTVEKGKGVFDYVLKISSLIPYKRIVIPFKSHKRLNYWLSQPLAKLLNGCTTDGKTATLWIKLPDLPIKTEGDELGIDIGYNKLLADSEGNFYGTEIKRICEKVRRKKPGSKGKRRSQAERKDYINRTVKQIPFHRLSVIAVENLTNLKRGKKPNRSKEFRKRLAPWSYCQALVRIEQIAAENRVRRLVVDPRHTSQECPICKWVARENRRGEKFRCTRCSYTADADTTGARNVIGRTRRTSQQPMVAAPS